MKSEIRVKECCLICGSFLIFLFHTLQADEDSWQRIDNGLYIGEFVAEQKSEIGDSKISVIKINPGYYGFKLVCGSEYENARLNAKGWCKKLGMICAINAGMYHKDRITHVGYCKNYNHVNSKNLNNYNAVLAFNPVDTTVPEIQIIDRKFQDFEKLKGKYSSFSQNIRMVTCEQKNVWSRQPERWSTAAIAIDKEGNALFIHCRSPYSVHDFINIVLALPLNIYNMAYLEGGPEASLYLSYNGIEKELAGSFEGALSEHDNNTVSWPLPNVIGVVVK